MPFDPTKPVNGTLVDADFLRSQFNALKAILDSGTITSVMVDAVNTVAPGQPANVSMNVIANVLHFTFDIPQGGTGADGAPGQQGPPFASALVDAVDTLPAGSNAAVSVNFDGTNVHFTFGVPRGADGTNGTNGTNGTDGNDGAPGPQGPPFASAVVDAVNTLPAGSDATVSVNFDGSNVRFTFGIPRGADGTNGTDGTNGANGNDGAPGEVSNAALASAIAGTSNNTNAVALLGLTVSDPPTQGEMQALASKLDELISAQRR